MLILDIIIIIIIIFYLFFQFISRHSFCSIPYILNRADRKSKFNQTYPNNLAILAVTSYLHVTYKIIFYVVSVDFVLERYVSLRLTKPLFSVKKLLLKLT